MPPCRSLLLAASCRRLSSAWSQLVSSRRLPSSSGRRQMPAVLSPDSVDAPACLRAAQPRLHAGGAHAGLPSASPRGSTAHKE
eukprot:1480827-Pyramimonas_sp.AAC.1